MAHAVHERAPCHGARTRRAARHPRREGGGAREARLGAGGGDLPTRTCVTVV